MIFPASAFKRMSLVVATFNDRRKSVTKSSSDGNVESSTDSLVESTTISVASAVAMLQHSSTSISQVGSGISNVASTIASPPANNVSLWAKSPRSPPDEDAEASGNELSVSKAIDQVVSFTVRPPLRLVR